MITRVKTYSTHNRIWEELYGQVHMMRDEVLQWLNEHATQCSTNIIYKQDTSKRYWACYWKYEDLEKPAVFHFTDKETAMLFKLTWI